MTNYSQAYQIKKYLCYSILSVLILLSFASNTYSAFSQDKKCIICHINRSEEFLELVADGVFDHELTDLVSEEICYSCHNVSVNDSRATFTANHHPVKVVPSSAVRIPLEYTLNEKGEMDCGTCHTPHTGKQKDNKIAFLRESNKNSKMCIKCHVALTQGPKYGEHRINVPLDLLSVDPEIITSRGGKLGDGNKIICETCHITHGAQKRKLLIYYEEGENFCSLCHEDNPSKESVGNGMETHPIYNEDIKSAVPEAWPNGRRIRRAKNGDFTCQTCHKAHYGYKGQLAYKNKTGEMCVVCHPGRTSSPEDEVKKNHILTAGDDETPAVNCISCHTAHNAFYDPESETAKLLVKSNADSDLCYECHSDKKTDNITIVELSGNHPNNMPFKEGIQMRSKLRSLGGKTGTDGNIICNSCHSIHDSKTKEANLIISKERLCLYCHDNQNFLNPISAANGTHPTNLLPKKATIPKEVLEKGQLSAMGEIICLTCHSVHSAQSQTKLLTFFNNKDEYCITCHSNMEKMLKGKHNLKNTAPNEKNILGQTVGESGMCGVCHTAHTYGREIKDKKKDVINQVCLGCHNADGIGADLGEEKEFNHPDNAFLTDKFRLYSLPIYTENGKRVVRNGKIMCSTCHNIHENEEYTIQKKLLRIKSENVSGICLNCHTDKKRIFGT